MKPSTLELLFWNNRNKALYFFDFQPNLCSVLSFYDNSVRNKLLHKALNNSFQLRRSFMYLYPKEKISLSARIGHFVLRC